MCVCVCCRFQQLCGKAYLALRHHYKLLVTLFCQLVNTGMPEVQVSMYVCVYVCVSKYLRICSLFYLFTSHIPIPTFPFPELEKRVFSFSPFQVRIYMFLYFLFYLFTSHIPIPIPTPTFPFPFPELGGYLVPP